MPHDVKSNCVQCVALKLIVGIHFNHYVQCVALKLIVGILFNLFLVDSPLLKEYKNQLIELFKNSNFYCFNNYGEIR